MVANGYKLGPNAQYDVQTIFASDMTVVKIQPVIGPRYDAGSFYTDQWQYACFFDKDNNMYRWWTYEWWVWHSDR
ncbi:hypothetical protein WS71_22940 [Burkholderia mayonis]|uniref:Uncharacterized protein n=1 Tax=Burkholderia mayonis TaxID=1385591 RepID=A0A1B4G2F7_9BURK|nr:hypothetical protein WS71_22940 [Burkholderia mayonis]KVE51472.1 hypothetical protein WS71_12390 [Burkholderia mayonis]